MWDSKFTLTFVLALIALTIQDFLYLETTIKLEKAMFTSVVLSLNDRSAKANLNEKSVKCGKQG